MSYKCPHNMANFGPLTAEIGSLVWGTSANFHAFCVLPSLLQRRCSAEANQTLDDVWPSPRLVHYIYIFGGSCPLTEFCPMQNSLYVQLFRYPILAALLHGTSPASVSQALRRATRNGIKFHPEVSFFFFFYLFFRLISAVGDWMSAILPHMVWP